MSNYYQIPSSMKMINNKKMSCHDTRKSLSSTVQQGHNTHHYYNIVVQLHPMIILFPQYPPIIIGWCEKVSTRLPLITARWASRWGFSVKYSWIRIKVLSITSIDCSNPSFVMVLWKESLIVRHLILYIVFL